MSEVSQQKAVWRRQLRSLVAALSVAERLAAAVALVRRVQEDDRWCQARTVMLFVPLPDEVDILPLVDQALEQGKAVLIPRFNPQRGAYEAARVVDRTTDLARGPFGVAEPTAGCPVHPLNQLDVTLVPGLGFDRVGRRLGRGKGHYDRLLKDASGEFWGVGYDCQLVPELPAESHDVVLNRIVTPAHWVEVVSGRR